MILEANNLTNILTHTFKQTTNPAQVNVILKVKPTVSIEHGLTLSAVIFLQIINFNLMIVDYKQQYVHQTLLI